MLNEDNKQSADSGPEYTQLNTIEREEEHCLQLILETSPEEDRLPKQIVSQLQTLKNDAYEDEQENKNETSMSSEAMRRNFQLMDLHINENLIKVTSDKATLITSHQTEQRDTEQHGPNLFNRMVKHHESPGHKIQSCTSQFAHGSCSKQFQTLKNTLNTSKDDNLNSSTDHQTKLRRYKSAARWNSLSVFGSNRFKNNLSIGNIPSKVQMNEGMFQNKKLASPVKCLNFRGDNNDDIPMQMTED